MHDSGAVGCFLEAELAGKDDNAEDAAKRVCRRTEERGHRLSVWVRSATAELAPSRSTFALVSQRRAGAMLPPLGV